MHLPPGYSISWSGQFEYLERAKAKLRLVIPFTLLVIFVLLYLIFQRMDEALLIMGTLPLAVIGGFWFIYGLGHEFSIASAVGFIALAGVAAEFGVVMLLYLNQAWQARLASGAVPTLALLGRGRSRRSRVARATQSHDGERHHRGPPADHVESCTGSEVMQRIAAR
ncbi:MAG: efflux RND transporter permease subunit [Gammaproteobacteria bacterium]